MENRQLRQLLGIEEIRKEAAAVEAIHLYGGFLLGGEAVYQAADEAEEEKRQDMELSFPWYGLSEDTKVYMCGIPKERVKAENRPPVIWRHNLDNAQVFVVNGKYMEDAAGLGLLTAMSAEARGYEIYPVVNAQNMVILNGPGMAAEYGETLKKQYGQSMPLLLRDVVWPLIVSTYKRCSLGLTCMISPQYDYVDDNFPSESELEYYMKRLKEQSAEAGLSGKNRSNTPINRKINEDERFVSATLPDYRFSSFYAGSLTELELDSILQEDMLEAVRTVVRDYSAGSEVIGYRSEYITSHFVFVQCVPREGRDFPDGVRPVFLRDGVDAVNQVFQADSAGFEFGVFDGLPRCRPFDGVSQQVADRDFEIVRQFLQVRRRRHRPFLPEGCVRLGQADGACDGRRFRVTGFA